MEINQRLLNIYSITILTDLILRCSYLFVSQVYKYGKIILI